VRSIWKENSAHEHNLLYIKLLWPIRPSQEVCPAATEYSMSEWRSIISQSRKQIENQKTTVVIKQLQPETSWIKFREKCAHSLAYSPQVQISGQSTIGDRESQCTLKPKLIHQSWVPQKSKKWNPSNLDSLLTTPIRKIMVDFFFNYFMNSTNSWIRLDSGESPNHLESNDPHYSSQW